MGALRLVSGSTVEPVSRTEAKLWLRVDEHSVSEDPLIDSLVTRARERFEDVSQKSCIINTFDFYPDETPEGPLTLPKAPLVTVTSIRAFASTDLTDSGGTAMSTDEYYVDTAHDFGRVMPLSAYVYPTSTRDINPLVVRFTAGYSSGSSGVPEGIKTEIKQLVAALYEHRGDEPEQARILEQYDGAEYALPTWG